MAQTRRFLGGRQPLWGIGVTSLMETTRSPTEASAWIADSRPLPGPWTSTCSFRPPRFIASRPTFSAATVAAKGVLFFEPLNPAFPAVPHAMVFPRMSVMVMSTLLNVAEMWAMPSASTTLRDFLTAGALAGAAPGGAAAAGAGEGGGGGAGGGGGGGGRVGGSRHGLLIGRLLLARDRAARAALGARVGVSPLAPDRSEERRVGKEWR